MIMLWSTIRGNRHSSDANRQSTFVSPRLLNYIRISLVHTHHLSIYYSPYLPATLLTQEDWLDSSTLHLIRKPLRHFHFSHSKSQYLSRGFSQKKLFIYTLQKSTFSIHFRVQFSFFEYNLKMWMIVTLQRFNSFNPWMKEFIYFGITSLGGEIAQR